MPYVDGFVLPVPKKNVQAYRRIAQTAAKLWRKPGETVVFAWIVFKSRAHRDSVNAKVMKDPRLAEMMTDPKAMPFDVKRMAYGGFKVIVDA